MNGYLQRRRALIAEAEGPAGARALSDLTDGAVSALAGAASCALSRPFSIFALGGYGARRLLPHSDIDLLVVTEAPRAEAQAFVRSVLYPLWDAGLTVGHQVRTPSEQVRAVAGDLEVLASFLTARRIAGDPTLADRTLKTTFKRIAKLAGPTLRQIEQRQRAGSPYLLEPDLKAGAGGQRDLDELVWRAALEAGAPQEDCLSFRLLREAECLRLDRAQDAITRARWRLHRGAQRPTNLLTLEVVEVEGIEAEAVQRALEVVHHTLLALRERAAGRESVPAPPRDARELIATAASPDGVDALERLAFTGALERIVPRFSAFMTLRRPALTHRYTVGAHSLRTLASATGAETFAGLTDRGRQILAVAALAHDLGKRTSGTDHAERGAADTTLIAERLGLAPAAAADAAALVREHLLLDRVATTRDLNDEDIILETAARLGKADLVAPLLQLTEADVRSTSSEAWTPWRASLVAELAGKLEAALAPDTDGVGIVSAAEATRAEAVRQAARVGAPGSVLRFLENAPLRYLARRTPEEVLLSARLVQSLSGPGTIGEAVLSVRSGPIDDTSCAEVVTRDRPGLFAAASGALALAGLDLLSAEAFTDRSGIVLDTFTVASATLAPIEPATWAAFERALRLALHDPSALDTRLAERLRHYPPRATRASRTRVTLVHAGPFTTGVRVRTADRVGLLHDLARAVELAGLDIRRATIATTAGLADDTFELTDADGLAPGTGVVADRLVPLLKAAARSARKAR